MPALKNECVGNPEDKFNSVNRASFLWEIQEKSLFWNVMLEMSNFQITMWDIAVRFGKAWRSAKRLWELGRQLRGRPLNGLDLGLEKYLDPRVSQLNRLSLKRAFQRLAISPQFSSLGLRIRMWAPRSLGPPGRFIYGKYNGCDSVLKYVLRHLIMMFYKHSL